MKQITALKTKAAQKNLIYKAISPLTRGLFNDEHWGAVKAVFAAIEGIGGEVETVSALYVGDLMRLGGSEEYGKVWRGYIWVDGKRSFDFYLKAALPNGTEGHYDIACIIS